MTKVPNERKSVISIQTLDRTSINNINNHNNYIKCDSKYCQEGKQENLLIFFQDKIRKHAKAMTLTLT